MNGIVTNLASVAESFFVPLYLLGPSATAVTVTALVLGIVAGAGALALVQQRNAQRDRQHAQAQARRRELAAARAPRRPRRVPAPRAWRPSATLGDRARIDHHLAAVDQRIGRVLMLFEDDRADAHVELVKVARHVREVRSWLQEGE